MAPSNNEDQFKFLISCIRYSNNGRLTSGLSLNSAKRYERIMKAHGIAPNTSPGKLSGQSPSSKGGSSKGSSTKKRKVVDTLGSTGDDDEQLGSGLKSEFFDENIIKQEIPFEQNGSGGGNFGSGLTAVEYESGINSKVEIPNAGEALETELHAQRGGDAPESIVID
ncbi:hypothetical protein FGG08_007346 [Glutinoglossum americanum]|uniref:Uncharacterized protein n=1 Tax=Glutinoglossum americanum TaxID=1670608 RepID=A0A9P8HU48_9PEZI|nr:hypothetical protein FGG08_007346 [Glutinoglossum americanum]